MPQPKFGAGGGTHTYRRRGCSTHKRYQGPVLWARLEMFFTPQRHPWILKQHGICGPFEAKHGAKKYQNRFLLPKGTTSTHCDVIFIWEFRPPSPGAYTNTNNATNDAMLTMLVLDATPLKHPVLIRIYHLSDLSWRVDYVLTIRCLINSSIDLSDLDVICSSSKRASYTTPQVQVHANNGRGIKM